MKKFNVRCGISRSFEQLSDLRLHYDQAITALNVGINMEYDKLVYYYDLNAIYHITKVYAESGFAESFIHPALGKLLKYDREYNTDFVYTLNEYFKHFGNITNLSKVLNLHRNTIIYRIQRTEEIMNVSLSDYIIMEQMAFSLRLIEYNKKTNYTQDTGDITL